MLMALKVGVEAVWDFRLSSRAPTARGYSKPTRPLWISPIDFLIFRLDELWREGKNL